METTYNFYVLKDPRDNQIKYVGITSRSLEQRLLEHSNHEPLKRTYKANWIKSLKKEGASPIIELLYAKTCNLEEALQEEQALIKEYLKEGVKLTNSIGVFTHANTLLNLRKMGKNARKKIIMTTLDNIFVKEYESLQSIEKDLNLSSGFLSSVLTGRKPTIAGKYRLFLKEDFLKGDLPVYVKHSNVGRKMKPEHYAPFVEKIRAINCKKTHVTNLITGQEYLFDCLQDAARYFGVQQSNAVKVLSGKRHHTQNLFFKYVEDIVETEGKLSE